jgi:hypothetical protein
VAVYIAGSNEVRVLRILHGESLAEEEPLLIKHEGGGRKLGKVQHLQVLLAKGRRRC